MSQKCHMGGIMEKKKVIAIVESILNNNWDLLDYTDELTPDEVDWAINNLELEIREIKD